MSSNSKMKKSYNYGLFLLRFIAIFMVVLIHTWMPSYAWPMSDFTTLAVPIFVILSFYLTAPSMTHPHTECYQRRLFRLLVPYLVWPLIWTVLFLTAGHFLQTQLVRLPGDLILQLMFGSADNLMPAFWYLWCVLILTAILPILWRILPEKAAFACTILLIPVAFVLQYSSLNVCIFGNLPTEISIPCGRLCEVIPAACAGILLGYEKIPERLSSGHCRYICILFNLTVWICLSLLHNQIADAPGFGYGGIRRFLLTISAFLLFALLPVEHLSERSRNFLKKLVGTSMGIYAIHYGFGRISYIFLTGRGINAGNLSLLLSCIYFLASLIITLLLQKIAAKCGHNFFGKLLGMLVS